MRGQIDQAQGAVSVDLGISVDEALVLMKAHAERRGQSRYDLAPLILAGEVVLDSASDLKHAPNVLRE